MGSSKSSNDSSKSSKYPTLQSPLLKLSIVLNATVVLLELLLCVLEIVFRLPSRFMCWVALLKDKVLLYSSLSTLSHSMVDNFLNEVLYMAVRRGDCFRRLGTSSSILWRLIQLELGYMEDWMDSDVLWQL